MKSTVVNGYASFTSISKKKIYKNLVYLCGIVERNHKKNNSEILARMI